MRLAPPLRRLTAGLLALSILPLWSTAAWADTKYTVQAGETLSEIAARFGTTVEALAEANEIANARLIQPGQTLVIPDPADGSPTPSVADSGNTGDTGTTASPNRLRPAASASPDTRLAGRIFGSGAGAAGGTAPVSQTEPAAEARPTGAAPAGPGSILTDRRLVTYYGNPWSDQMGILGELSPSGLVRELNKIAARYEAVSDKPVQPAIHLIVTVAQAGPGDDGMYRARMPESMIEEYSTLAEENGMLLILDVQVGLSDVATEIEPLRKYLERPHVHLALDPEFDMDPGEKPGGVIGTTDASDINHATRWLAEIVDQNNLPNKVLLIHQFNRGMLRDKAAIANDPRVDIVIDMDGFGDRDAKIQNYLLYAAQETPEFNGIKLFYQHDVNLMSPDDILALEPPPDVVIYQ